MGVFAFVKGNIHEKLLIIEGKKSLIGPLCPTFGESVCSSSPASGPIKSRWPIMNAKSNLDRGLRATNDPQHLHTSG